MYQYYIHKMDEMEDFGAVQFSTLTHVHASTLWCFAACILEDKCGLCFIIQI